MSMPIRQHSIRPGRPSRTVASSGGPDRTNAPGTGHRRSSLRWRFCKRAFDVVAATVLLLVFLPVMLLAAVAIKLDSRGPCIFRQRRYGRDLRPFVVWKLRTMHDGASAEPHRRYIAIAAAGGHDRTSAMRKLTDDPRVTRVGAFLRTTSIDELPQLVNVLRGQMSIVGPRPALEYELDHYAAVHFDRFLVRPGITGLWQVSGRGQLDFREMLDLDVSYAHRCGIRLDAMILMRTPRAVLEGSTA